MTRPTAPQAITAPENRLGAGAGAGLPPGPGLVPAATAGSARLGRAPVAWPDFPDGDLPDTGRLWALLRSLALWFDVPPERAGGLGVFPPVTGFFFWSSAIVRISPIRLRAAVSVTGRTKPYGIGPTSEARATERSASGSIRLQDGFPAYTDLAMLQDAMSEASAAGDGPEGSGAGGR